LHVFDRFFLPILGKPDLGVDLFILLSGFLMAFQYQIRKDKEDWGKPAIWVAFWVRRFFRLSPLYFVLLVVALAAGKSIYTDRVLIDTFLHNALQRPERYTDASATNIFMHLTYAFGLTPAYAFRTALPDWSLGLEMQFYAVFPFAVLLVRRVGWIPASIAICVVSIGLTLATKALGISFPMPSFLPLKMHLFVAGMLIAAAIGKGKIPFFLLAILLAAVPIGGSRDMLHTVVREVILIGFFALIHWRNVLWIGRMSSLLGTSPFRWLGELSYGVYLVHLLILHRVAAWTINQWGGDISNLTRFGITLAITTPIAYGISYTTYLMIERPGQNLGRTLLAALGKQRQSNQTVAEKIAAP
jgi:peptidoglycan/LPS O-acetylase OafA/YrhL